MEQLNKILIDYVSKLSTDYRTAIATNNATPELSFRPSLDDFLVQMAGFISNKIEEYLNHANRGNMADLTGCLVTRIRWVFMATSKQKGLIPISH